MTDVTELISAMVAIAKDPKAWEKRIDDMTAAAGNLTTARKLKADTDQGRQAAEKDLETARYERGQAERASRDTAQQSAANNNRGAELDKREREVAAREQAHERDAANLKSNLEQREHDLELREKLVAKKLADAQKLLANYDEAKHQAALKLAS